MDLNQLLLLIMNLSTLVFVMTSMLAMGLILTVERRECEKEMKS
jgi:hypothetical protein